MRTFGAPSLFSSLGLLLFFPDDTIHRSILSVHIRIS
jgi:hypothetical protein